MRRYRGLALAALAALVAMGGVVQAAPPPRLVLQITVDQLRGDLLSRYRSRFGAGGFNLLLTRGVYYANAHYETANTLTCAGHAVLVTGADVAQHGIVSNDWFDRETGKPVYCADDPESPAVGEPGKAGQGLSPRLLTSTTIGDEIVIGSGRRSRAFAVSGKDRSAIVPGGHLGKAFWASSKTGGFASSQYYYDALPAWAQAWNGRKLFQQYRGPGWKLARPLDTYVNAARAGNELAHPKANIGRTFPHSLDMADAELIAAMRFTPYLDELMALFAQELIGQEKLGQKGVTDYLSLSFSATDYVGHSFGANSVESEDNIERLDGTLAKLFAFIDRTIGLRNTVIVLSADHGADDIPEERLADHFDAGRVGGEPLRGALNAALKARFNGAEGLVAAVIAPGIYLDRARMTAQRLDPAAVEAALAEELRRQPGIAYAITRTDLLAGRIPNTPLLNSVQRAFHPERSGDVIIVQKEFWFLDDEPDYYAAMHGSPYAYDTYVPIILLAPGAAPATINEPTAPAQIAPTLAALLHIKPPSGCVCDAPLPGVLD